MASIIQQNWERLHVPCLTLFDVETVLSMHPCCASIFSGWNPHVWFQQQGFGCTQHVHWRFRDWRLWFADKEPVPVGDLGGVLEKPRVSISMADFHWNSWIVCLHFVLFRHWFLVVRLKGQSNEFSDHVLNSLGLAKESPLVMSRSLNSYPMRRMEVDLGIWKPLEYS